jgi:hypothetical protein
MSTRAVTYVAAPAIRHVMVDGLLCLLDLRSETYRLLDPVASAFWAVLCGMRREPDVFAELAAAYHVDPVQLQDDLRHFAKTCQSEGLLIPAQATMPADRILGKPRMALPGWLHAPAAFLSLVTTRRAIARRGFSSVYADYSRLTPCTTGSRHTPDTVLRAVRSFRRAENLFVSKRAPDDCLARSLALYRYLLRIGIKAEHRIGVRRIPFKAHAWVEIDGEAPLETHSHAFSVIAKLNGQVT